MAKAILVMDMPSRCRECKFRFGYRCEVERSAFDSLDEKPTWCPLREVPQKRTELTEGDGLAGIVFNNGYNVCIDEILGGGE